MINNITLDTLEKSNRFNRNTQVSSGCSRKLINPETLYSITQDIFDAIPCLLHIAMPQLATRQSTVHLLLDIITVILWLWPKSEFQKIKVHQNCHFFLITMSYSGPGQNQNSIKIEVHQHCHFCNNNLCEIVNTITRHYHLVLGHQSAMVSVIEEKV